MPKRLHCVGINDISCVWNIVISFVTNDVQEIIPIIQVQKKWTLKRLSHLVNANVEYKNLQHIENLNFNKLTIICKDVVTSPNFSQVANVKNLTIDSKKIIQKLNLRILKRCRILKLTHCLNTKIPYNIKELELEYSSYDVWESNCEELIKLTISNPDYDQSTFQQLRHFPNLKELWLMNCPYIYELGICERLDTLILASDFRRDFGLHLYTSYKQLFLTRLDVDLEVVDLELFDHLPILTTLSIYNLVRDQNNLHWIVKLKSLKSLHFYYFTVFPNVPILPNVEISYIETV
jgi:hypothetical protein